MDFWQTVAAAALGAFLAKTITEILGFHLNQSSALEADRDADMEKILKDIQEVREHGAQYWCNGQTEDAHKVLAHRITAKLLGIGQTVDRLFTSDSKLKEAVVSDLNRFDDEITHGNFGVVGRPSDHERILSIELCAATLENKIQTCRRKLRRQYVRLSRADRSDFSTRAKH